MTLAERDTKLKRLETILENRGEDPSEIAIQLAEIWLYNLWEVCDDSFSEFLASEFEMSEADAFLTMKLAVSAGVITGEQAAKIEAEFERL